jgi:hypothetical protein
VPCWPSKAIEIDPWPCAWALWPFGPAAKFKEIKLSEQNIKIWFIGIPFRLGFGYDFSINKLGLFKKLASSHLVILAIGSREDGTHKVSTSSGDVSSKGSLCMSVQTNELKLQELQYYVIPGEKIAPEYRSVHQEAYRMWKTVWSQTLLEVDGDGRVYSDHFSRQTNIGALFRAGECVAMTVQHEVDFNDPTAADDSYFQAWPQRALDELVRDGKRVLICSHLTVAPGHRGEVAPGLTYKLLIVDLAVKLLLNSDCNVMTGTMRKVKGAHKTAFQTGASLILEDVIQHGETADLVGFYKNTILANQNLVKSVWTDSLWRQRMDLTRVAQAEIAGSKKAGSL